MYLGYGTVPLKAVVTGLKKKRFDGFATVEIIQRDWARIRPSSTPWTAGICFCAAGRRRDLEAGRSGAVSPARGGAHNGGQTMIIDHDFHIHTR